jgi:hypothetical protein
MTNSFPSNFENKSNNHSDSIDALEAKISGLRAVIQYLKEQKSNPEEIEMKQEELDKLEEKHFYLKHGDDDVIVFGDDDAIVSNPDDEGDAPQSGSSTGDLERKVAEMQSRMDKQSQTKPLSKVGKAGMGLVAAALTSGTGLYLAAPKNTPVTPTPLETQNTAPNPEQRQAPTVNGVENSAEQFRAPFDITYKSPNGVSTMVAGDIESALPQQKQLYEDILAGKPCAVLPPETINGKQAFRVIVRGGETIRLTINFGSKGLSQLILNHTSGRPVSEILIYTINTEPLATQPLLYDDGSIGKFLPDNSVVTAKPEQIGSGLEYGSFHYSSSGGDIQGNIPPVSNQTSAQPSPSPNGPFEHFGFGSEDFTGPSYR